MTLQELLLKGGIQPNGCVLIGKSNGKRRYPCITFDGKPVPGHRLAWRLSHGAIPHGLEVCHTCDNDRCVNPEHLFLATHAENMRDCAVKGRQGRRKITDDQVMEIRASTASTRKLASQYGIGHNQIARIKRGESFRHLIPNAGQHDYDRIRKFHAKSKSYSLTMRHFGITSKGTLHYILKTSQPSTEGVSHASYIPAL